MSVLDRTDVLATSDTGADGSKSAAGSSSGSGSSASSSEVRRRLRPDASEVAVRSSRPRSLHEVSKVTSPNKKTIWSRMKTSAAKQMSKIKHRTKERMIVPADRVISSSQPELCAAAAGSGFEHASVPVKHNDTQSENLLLSQSGHSLASSALTSTSFADDGVRSATLGRLGGRSMDEPVLARMAAAGASDIILPLDSSPVRQRRSLSVTAGSVIGNEARGSSCSTVGLAQQQLQPAVQQHQQPNVAQQQQQPVHGSRNGGLSKHGSERLQQEDTGLAEFKDMDVPGNDSQEGSGWEPPLVAERLAKECSRSPSSSFGSSDHRGSGQLAIGYTLAVTLIKGVDLISRDSNGFSDPYVKLKVCGKVKFKSKIVYKSLNPLWNERFVLQLRDLQESVVLCVLDRDTFTQDDDMGSATIYPCRLPVGQTTELKLRLEGCSSSGSSRQANGGSFEEEKLGHLVVLCELSLATCDQPLPAASSAILCSAAQTDLAASRQASAENSPQLLRRGAAVRAGSTRSLSPPKSDSERIVHVALLEAHDLLPMDHTGLSDPYVRLRLGKEKRKSGVKKQTLSPKWQEEFSMHMYPGESSLLEIEVYDYNVAARAAFIGRASVELSTLARDKTHRIEQRLDEDAGTVVLLITVVENAQTDSDSIDSSAAMATVTDASGSSSNISSVAQRYGLSKSFENMADVGWLTVTVHRAQDLPAKDWDGKSDPFCVLELVNTRLQTHTVYNSLNPDWERTFTMEVTDIHSVLEVTVFDEDKDLKREFLGKVAIPLLKVNNGRPTWYALKDHKLTGRAKGEILLDITIAFNPVRAAIRTFNPREQKQMQREPKFKIGMFKANATRAKAILDALIGAKNFWQGLVDWHVPSRTVIAFFLFVVVVWHFEPFMAPAGLLLLYGWAYYTQRHGSHHGDVGDTVRPEGDAADDDEDSDDETVDDDEADRHERRPTIRRRIGAVLSVALVVQNVLGHVASIGERVKNSVNWTVPWLSALAVAVLCVATIILYFIPLRLIVLLWGINKFTKKLRKPNYISNNELLDYLSCIPTDQEKVLYSAISRLDGQAASGKQAVRALHGGTPHRSSPVASKAALNRQPTMTKR